MADELDIRGKILDVATELLTRKGYSGFRFSDAADRLNITRGNIHYHFKNKENLVDEVVTRYVDVTLQRTKRICFDQSSSFSSKIGQMTQLQRERYERYNPSLDTGHGWSLIARMRLERDVIGPRARQAIESYSAGLDRYARRACEIALARGELRPDAPVGDLVLLLAAIANSADPITRDASSFERLAELYGGLNRIIRHAYGIETEAGATPEAVA